MFHPFARRQTGMTYAATPKATEWTCPRCGLPPVRLHPVESAGVVRLLVARFEVLFRHADREALVHHLPENGSRSAVGHAEDVAYRFADLDEQLGDLIGDEGTFRPLAAAHSTEREPSRVLAFLTGTGRRLAHTIIGATDADWQHPATRGVAHPLDLVRRTLHQAVHRLHDAEQGLHTAPGPDLVRPVELPAPGGRVPPALLPIHDHPDRQPPGHDAKANGWPGRLSSVDSKRDGGLPPPEDHAWGPIPFDRGIAMFFHPSNPFDPSITALPRPSII